MKSKPYFGFAQMHKIIFSEMELIIKSKNILSFPNDKLPNKKIIDNGA